MGEEKHSLPTIAQISEFVEKSYGTKVERTLLEIAESWKELEADPGLFSLLARDLAGEEIEVVEIYDLQFFESFLGSDEKVYGLVFLFECREGQGDRSQRTYNKDLHKKYFRDESFINHKMFFALQKAPNSCATHALLSIILNNADLPLTPLMQEFKAFTQEMQPETRGYAIGNSPQFAAFHNRRAPSSPDVVATVESNMRKTTESSRPRRTYIRQNHFVTYVHIDGKLMELDGLKDHPICHGPVTAGDYVKVTLEHIHERIISTTSTKGEKDRHSILLVKASRRTRCIRHLASVHSVETTTIDQIESLMETLKSPALPVECQELPLECQELITSYRKRIIWSPRPEDFPTNLDPIPQELSSLCDKITSILVTLQQKLSIDSSDQKSFISSLVPLVPNSPLRNGFSVERDHSPEIVIRRLGFLTPKSAEITPNSFIATNGFCGPPSQRERRSEIRHESSGEWVKRAQIWRPSVTLCAEPDLTLITDIQALSGECIKKNTTIETRKQRAAAKNHRTGNDGLLSIPRKVASRNGRNSVSSGPDQIPITLQSKIKEDPGGDFPVVPAKTRLSTPVVSKREPVVIATTPPERLINRITKVDGRLRSSSIAHSSKSLQAEEPSATSKSMSALVVESRESPTTTNAFLSPSASVGREDVSDSPSRRLRTSRSSLSQRTPEKIPERETLYRSIVLNPLTEAKNRLEILERQMIVTTDLQANVNQFVQLEKQRTDLLKIIIEENGKREEDLRNAVDREFPHADYITVMFKRLAELRLISRQETVDILPPKPVPSSKRAAGSESDESLQSRGVRRRMSSSNDDEAVSSKKRRS